MRISDHSFMKKNAKLFYVPPWIYCVCVCVRLVFDDGSWTYTGIWTCSWCCLI